MELLKDPECLEGLDYFDDFFGFMLDLFVLLAVAALGTLWGRSGTFWGRSGDSLGMLRGSSGMPGRRLEDVLMSFATWVFCLLGIVSGDVACVFCCGGARRLQILAPVFPAPTP